ncbi:hypothetical protein E3G68_005134 [Mycobacteroides abscessus]|uniref:FAD-dependent oxidoreductase n=1 Tax=Mycobacteroides abscessus TaxID=36809 RepID=UPI00187884D9|nr:hypothetical protein [Mycobacteroides abscessus]
MTTCAGIVLVGGGLAAARIGEELRRAEFAGPITIVSDEAHLPYDRPPLSKGVLRGEIDDVLLKPADFYADNDITVRLGSAATALDTATNTVTLADGDILPYDELVIATGLIPKRITSLPDLAGVHVLRTLDESLALRNQARSGRRAVVIGAGFIGCEVAASLRALGIEATIVEPQPAPLASVLGVQIGDLVARLHRAEGVDVRCGVGVTSVTGTGHVERVHLSDGTELGADIVVVGIGSRPSTDWLQDSGVKLGDGVLCDAHGRTTAPHVWAIGDVASWQDATGRRSRVEHWSNIAEQARVIVPAMLGHTAPGIAAVPYFWSDQYDVKIQCLGEPAPDDVVHVVEDDGRRFLAYYERDGVVTGVVGGGLPGKVMKARARIARTTAITDVLPVSS